MDQSIKVRLFGAFRQYAENGSIRVPVADAATVAELRTAFGDVLEDDNARSLLRASAFATDERVLDETDPVPADREISILPPVCGG